MDERLNASSWGEVASPHKDDCNWTVDIPEFMRPAAHPKKNLNERKRSPQFLCLGCARKIKKAIAVCAIIAQLFLDGWLIYLLHILF